MVDIHTHILPGIDDGCTSFEESLDLARAAAAVGTRVMVATPHVRDDFPNGSQAIERLVGELTQRLGFERIDIRVLPGAEIALDRIPRLPEEELRRLTLGGAGRYLLIETPYHGWPTDFEQRVFELQLLGLTPVIAHPERNGSVQEDPSRLAALVQRGALVQLTASSLEGRSGRGAQRLSRRLLDAGLAHVVASDAHAVEGRSLSLSRACGSLRDERLSAWLTTGVGAALVAGREPPPSPHGPRPSWWRRTRDQLARARSPVG